MSDLLGRLAARAVGAPALAQPRLPVSHAGPAAAGIEIVDEQVVVPGAPPRALARPPGEPGWAEPHRVSEAAPVPAAPVEATPTVRIAVPPAAPAAEAPRRARPLPALEPVSAVPTAAEPDARPAEPRTAVAVTAVPATPAVPVLAAPALAPAPAAAAAARDEPPPVRVHIGRLEVRASLDEAPRSQPLTQPREPEGLSLSDYLRGRRGA